MSRSCIPLLLLTVTASICLSLILFKSLPSLPVPVHAAALRTVDGASGGGALRPAGENGGVSERAGLSALWPVVHGGRCRRAPGARLRVGLHAGGPCAACQQVSFPSGLWWNKRLTFICPATGTEQHAGGM